ncbi:hypothetical protein BYT27DRAFT_7253687 [Phlegmacium glaucopus]|nr:hypothetical protein BYT27DRAFT_7253687 [Phlegmacium glaucopus]
MLVNVSELEVIHFILAPYPARPLRPLTRVTNKSYVESFDKGALEILPSIVGTAFTLILLQSPLSNLLCPSKPASPLGIGLGEAHVIRNAGASAVGALRSIFIS